jgi:trans-AT polyketide synthase/acyltransferase/oxidoreductase domain-containing protein
MKIFLFPGQGAQFIGMGNELFKRYPVMISSANEILGYDIAALCEEDTEHKLSQTEYTQPALYVVNALSYLTEVEEKGPPDIVMGHSFGEFAALYAAGVFSFEVGLQLVMKRAELTGNVRGGKMAALIGMTMNEVLHILEACHLTSIDIANYNSEKQIIIAGLNEDMHAAQEAFKSNNLKLYLELNVSGPFHSRYMKSAAEKFGEYLSYTKFNALNIKTISNVTAKEYTANEIAPLLETHLVSTVRWYESISRVLQYAGDLHFKEIGPGDTLTGMLNFIKQAPMKFTV